MDIVSIFLGLLPIVIGIGILLVSWLDKNPARSRVVKMLCWPRAYQDRKQLALTGLFFCALGGFMVLSATGAGIYLLALVGFGILGLGVAVRLRQPAV